MGALALAACHADPVVAPCAGDCAESGAGGAALSDGSAGEGGGDSVAGQGSISPGMAGAGPIEPDCARDEDCDDGSACNGDEQCRDGACTPGERFECAEPAECSNVHAGPACVYPSSERFIVYAVDDLNPWWNWVGTSTGDLDNPQQVNLSEGANDAEFTYVDDLSWSPDGRRLIFPAMQLVESKLVFDQKFFWFDFTQPVADQPRRLPDVPINDELKVMTWSARSGAVLVGYNDFGRTALYAVRFTETGAETATVPADGAVELCADETTIAYEVGGETHLAAAWSSRVNETVLPALLRGRSPDGNWLLLSDDEHAYLAKCGPETELEPLAGPASIAGEWSPDSRFVVYFEQGEGDPDDESEDEEPSNETLNGFRVESATEHTAIFQAQALADSVSFEPGGTRILYLSLDEQGQEAQHLADMTDPGLDRVIQLRDEQGAPISSDVWWLGATDRFVYFAALDSQDEDSPVAAYSVSTALDATPRRLTASFTSLNWSQDNTHMVWIEAVGDSLTQAYSLDLRDEGSRPHALFPEPLTGTLRFPEQETQARVLLRDIDFPEPNTEIFVVPEDFKGLAVSVKRGRVLMGTGGVSLQPLP
jgi:hypothetical protein